MKEKIKNWVSPNIVMAVAYTTFAIYTICVGDWVIGMLCLAIALCCFCIHLKDRKCKKLLVRVDELHKIAKECNDNEKKAVQTTQWAYDELQLEMQRLRLTSLQGMIYKNKADFMQRKKSLSLFLEHDQSYRAVYEQEVKRLHEMMDEIKKEDDKQKEKPKE